MIKKRYIYSGFVTILFGGFFLLSACGDLNPEIEGSNQISESPPPALLPSSTISPSSSSPTPSDSRVSPSPNITPEPTDLKLKGIPYKSIELGWQIFFPQSWKGYYLVQPNASYGITKVSFVGQSNLSKGDDDTGIEMFFIIDQVSLDADPFWDSVHQIGIVNGVKYYYGTAMDSPLSVLFEANRSDDYEATETEREHIRKDWEKVEEMRKDVEAVRSSFESLE